MRAFITGLNGFVGGHLCQHLLASGDTISGIARNTGWPVELQTLAREIPFEDIDLASVDCASLAALLKHVNPEAVYHLAAQANPQDSVGDPFGTWALNLGGTLRLLEAVRQSGLTPRILLVSSGVVYGNPTPENIPVAESCPIRPNNPYAASKAAADLLGIQYSLAHEAHVVIGRPFNHAGPRQSDRYALSSFARQIVQIEQGKQAQLDVGNLDIVRDYTDVRDIVRAYRLLVRHGRAGEVYNIGTGRNTSLGQMLETLCALARVQVEVRTDPRRIRPVDQPLLLADPAKLMRTTSWEPAYTTEQTLSDMLNYWRES